tara:strand:- start:594 stop:773 length:180 start_codon:yes stop_codon:yes gene_type:complete
MSFWVVGGYYQNTRFEEIKEGYNLERYGPFDTYDDAKVHWEQHSWKNVDNCYIRYTIVK